MHINYVIHLLALRLWIPHNYDLERCGDCVSETCLLRQSNAKSIFQMDALLPDFDMLLFNCCREGEALCHAADLKKKKKLYGEPETCKSPLLLCSEANKRKQNVEEHDGV